MDVFISSYMEPEVFIDILNNVLDWFFTLPRVDIFEIIVSEIQCLVLLSGHKFLSRGAAL